MLYDHLGPCPGVRTLALEILKVTTWVKGFLVYKTLLSFFSNICGGQQKDSINIVIYNHNL